jgi:hypothetical protein
MKIAVDFDGTIVENQFPGIGRENIFAFMTLQEMQKKGHQLILWTCRTGRELEQAVEYCRRNGVEFYAVNANYPEEIFDESVSRKIVADYYIDDRVPGGFPGWGEVWQMINKETTGYSEVDTFRINRKGPGIIRKFFGRFIRL